MNEPKIISRGSDLLKEFVELAPKEWRATVGYLSCVGPVAEIVLDEEYGKIMTVALGDGDRFYADDHASAEAFIFLWDYLEGEGLRPCMSHIGCVVVGRDETGITIREDGEEYLADGSRYDPEPFPFQREAFDAPTRIEALVRACVAYWEAAGGGIEHD